MRNPQPSFLHHWWGGSSQKKYTFIFPSYFFVCCAPGSARSSSQVPRSSVLTPHHPPLPPPEKPISALKKRGRIPGGGRQRADQQMQMRHTHTNTTDRIKNGVLFFPLAFGFVGGKCGLFFIAATLNIRNSSLFWRMIFGGSEINK